MVLHKVEDSSRSKQDLEHKIRSTYNCKQYVIAQEPYIHVNPNTGLPQEGSHFHVFLQFKSKCYMNSVYSKLAQWWDGGQMKMIPLRGRLAQGCKYLMKDQGVKDKSYDPAPIIRLEADQADEVGVEATMVSREDVRAFRCWHPGCVHMLPCGLRCLPCMNFCVHWDEIFAKYRLQNPLPPRKKIRTSRPEIS